jgi:enoyl-CoA hydratase/carnithine racemase
LPVIYERQGRVALFTIDNGELSVFTPVMHRELHEHLRSFLTDPEVHVGVLRGRPGASFCAGDDIKTKLPARSRQQELEGYLFLHQNEGDAPHRPGWEVDVLRLERFKPIVAAVDGYCLGQGMIYLLHLTDLRVASTRAQFGLPEIAYGMGGAGGITRLGLQIPHLVAMRLLLTGEFMSADDACRYHLVNEVVPDGELMARTMALAEQVAAQPPVAVRVEMEAYYRSFDLSRDENLRYALNLYRLQRLGYEGYGAGTGFFGAGGRDGGAEKNGTGDAGRD